MRVGMHEMHALRVCRFFRDNGGGLRSLQHRFDIVPFSSASAGACPPALQNENDYPQKE